MGVLDLKHQLNRMLSERKGVSDRTVPNSSSYKDLATLKQNLIDMLSIRNGTLSLTRSSCPSHVGTTCSQHSYPNYTSITNATSLPNALSIGDIDKALNKLTYCTCNSRMIGACECQSNIYYGGSATNACSCNQRTIVECTCRNRDGGKYAHGFYNGYDCTCLMRTTAVCDCEARSASRNCTCDARCSCNVVKEFSYTLPNNSCSCNTQVIAGCSCNTEAKSICSAHWCDCQFRTSTLKYKSFPVYNYEFVGMKEVITPQPSEECPEHYTINNVMAYENRLYNPGGYYYENCITNSNSVNTTVNNCTCRSRCACNAQRVTTSSPCNCNVNIL